ncbi:MAG TPA: ABC transporter permease [Silvibacterium sp.]|nr:ABC transporter permease [Silvibacterium sp.]
MNFLKQDLWQAIRQLRNNRGFTLAAVITLALGIGANVTVFLVMYGVLLRPLPFPHSEQIVRLERLYPQGETAPAYSGTKFLFMRRASRTLDSVAAYDYIPATVNLVQGGDAVPIKALRATSDFFKVFQMQPRIGRGFSAQDMVPNAPGVVVISDALWRQRFGADPGILGRAITLGSQKYTVVGVARPEFRLDEKTDVWAPLQISEAADDQSNNYNVVARLKPDVTPAQAQDDLRRVLLELKSTYPMLWSKNEAVRVLNYQDSLVGNVRPALRMLMGAVLLLLVIVAANILSLLLTRAIARRREMSLRAALGATGWRILRQLLVENAILCIAGGIAGLVLAQFGAPALMHLSPIELPTFASLDISGTAIAFAAALTIACAVIFSVVPAFETRRTQLNESLRVNATQIASSRNLAQRALVVSEVAVSLVLIAGAALLLTSFWKLMHTAPGFSAENVLTFKSSFSADEAATSAQLSRRLNDLTARLEAIPGVRSAAEVSNLPTQIVPDLFFAIAGRSKGRSDAGGDGKYIPITAHYFNALSIPVIAGRAFTDSDRSGSTPVIIINQEIARALFNGESPIGQHLMVGQGMGAGFEDPAREIVGVVGDVKQTGLDQPVPSILYLPAAQIPDKLTQMGNGLLGESWIVRMNSANIDVATPARRIFMDNAQAPLLNVAPLSEVVSASVAQQRFNMILLSGFGLLSLLLGAAGLYGVLSYMVARQTKEIGVRMAIGAQRGDILRMILREAGLLVGVGLMLGVAASLAGAQVLQSLIFGVAPRDPAILAAGCGLLLMTGLFAAWWPARRAASTEPMEALRAE